MTDILVFTDPHLGKNLVSHTTQDSRRRLRDGMYRHTTALLDRFPHAKKACLGDLFDRFQNPEDVIWQGVSLARRVDYLMAGNHDLINDRDRLGTLQLLHKTDPGPIQLTPFGEAKSFLHEVRPGVTFLFVPHHCTDELFHQSLAAASDWVRGGKPTGSKAYLCLHCNYDSGFATDDTALSLTRKQAKDLLDDGFDYILIGHDHHPREDWQGRVVILGNTHPTGFGDITDKRVLLIRPDGRHEFHTVWYRNAGYMHIEVNDLLAPEVEFQPNGVQFVEITGEIEAGRVMDLARAVRKLWQGGLPLAVRNRVEVIKAGSGDLLAGHDFHQLDMQIRAELIRRPELVELFDSFWADTAPTLQEEEA